jgi:hypothetical protein
MRLFIAALLSAALVSIASPAMAERITIKDPAHDHIPPGGEDFHGVGDVIRVRVDHAPKRVYVDTVFRVEPYDNLEVELDTRKGRPGPEFYLLRTYLGVSLWRYTDQKGHTKRSKCADKGVKYLPKKRTWTAHVNRGCLRWPAKKGETPRQVRVRVLSASDDYYFMLDYVPGTHRYSRWAQHN